jgi:hypothetical protein
MDHGGCYALEDSPMSSLAHLRRAVHFWELPRATRVSSFCNIPRSTMLGKGVKPACKQVYFPQFHTVFPP